MRNLRNLTLVCILSAATPAVAQTDAAAEIAAIRGEIGRLVERLDRLEQAQVRAAPVVTPVALVAQAAPPSSADRPAAAPAATPPAAAATPPKAPDAVVRFSGDMRYRHEAIN